MDSCIRHVRSRLLRRTVGAPAFYSDSTITVSATVEERAFLQARVQMQNKWASAPVPRGTPILELL